MLALSSRDWVVVVVSSLGRVQLWGPTECSPPGSSVHTILQAEYWSRLPFPSPGDLPDPGIELHLQFIICISFLSKVGKKTNTSTFEIDSLLLLNPGWWAGVFHHYFLCWKTFANFYSGVHKGLPVLWSWEVGELVKGNRKGPLNETSLNCFLTAWLLTLNLCMFFPIPTSSPNLQIPT